MSGQDQSPYNPSLDFTITNFGPNGFTGAFADGTSIWVPAGSYITRQGYGFDWIVDPGFNDQPIRFKKLDSTESEWHTWGKVQLASTDYGQPGYDDNGESNNSNFQIEKWIMWGGVLLLLATGFYPLAIILAFVAILYQNLTDEDKSKNFYKWIIGIVIAIIAYTLIFNKRK